MVLPDSRGVSRAPRYLGVCSRKPVPFRLRAYHPLWIGFPAASTTDPVGNFPAVPQHRPDRSRNPRPATLAGLAQTGFGLFPFRSPLLRESRLLSPPKGTEMFHFPSFASGTYGFSAGSRGFAAGGFPIRKSPGQSLFGGSPELIAACHVLHRLLTPGHPPCALIRLTTTQRMKLIRTHSQDRLSKNSSPRSSGASI